MEMPSKEFAEKYVGRRVRIINTNDVPDFTHIPTPIGIITQYTGIRVIVDLQETHPGINHWMVFLRHIELLDEKVINPYPHICKACKSPARKNSDVALCSNVKCKSSNKKKYFIPYVKVVDKYIKCAICDEFAYTCRDRARAGNDIYYSFSCFNKHNWQIKVYPGMLLKQSEHVIYYMNKDLSGWTRKY